MAQKPPTIFINPKFKNAHINPNFLKSSNSIHVNPKFLNLVAPPAYEPPVNPPLPPLPDGSSASSNTIIRNTRRTLIRMPAVARPSTVVAQKPPAPPNQLIRISKNKIVTAAHLMQVQQKENEIIKQTTESIIKSKKLQRKTESSSIYKLDRRSEALPKRKKKIVSKYSIRRVDASTPKKAKAVRDEVLINGVPYKATHNKLERKSIKDPSEKLLTILGAKFVLDRSCRKLEQDGESRPVQLSRLHVGGQTYKVSQSGAYERDNSHQFRNHLIATKKKIMKFARSVTVKVNTICPVYRRLGKCLAYANGRCHKVHDPRYVIVCPNYLKDSCQDEKCLLSHNANFHKMPVCKYFLKGLCQKQRECRYLHKKLTDDTKLCAEFLKGFCPLAEKCELLHDFVQSEHNKKFSFVRKKSRNYVKKLAPDADESKIVPKRGKLGKLPSFIPL